MSAMSELAAQEMYRQGLAAKRKAMLIEVTISLAFLVVTCIIGALVSWLR